MSVDPGMGEPPGQQSGNPFLGQSSGSSSVRRPVITGYQSVQTEIPYYLANPNAVSSGQLQLSDGGFSPMPSTMNYAGREFETPTYDTQENILAGLATLEATDPENYKILEDKLDLTKFNSWEDLLDSASFAEMPWDEYLDYRVEVDQQLYPSGGGGGYSGPTTQIYLSSESQAGQMLDQAFTQYLGRTASDDEVKIYQRLLNEAQRANPAVTTSSGGTVVTEGQFDPTRFAREYTQSQEGYAERFAAVTFMDALDKALANRGNYVEQFAKGEQ